MTDPRQPGPTDNGSSRYPTYSQANGRYTGYGNTEVDDLEGLGQDDEVGIARAGAGGFERYWQAPRTLAPDYDEPQPQQGPSGRDPNAAAGGQSGAGEPTAWWNSAELTSRLNEDQKSPESWRGGASEQPEPPAEAARNVEPAPQPQQDWSERLGYDPDATVSASAVTGSWARSAVPDSETVATAYPESEGYSVGSVASAAQARAEATAAPRAEKNNGGPRRARLMLRHIDPLSTLKFTLVLSIAMFVVWMVAVGVLYEALNGMGVFDKINSTINDVNGSDTNVITGRIVFGAAAVIGAVNIVLFTALATVGSFIYNLCADMVGGLELTLAERD